MGQWKEALESYWVSLNMTLGPWGCLLYSTEHLKQEPRNNSSQHLHRPQAPPGPVPCHPLSSQGKGCPTCAGLQGVLWSTGPLLLPLELSLSPSPGAFRGPGRSRQPPPCKSPPHKAAVGGGQGRVEPGVGVT